MLFSKREIAGKRKPVNGQPVVVIDPFDSDRLGANTYDVSLGEWYYRTRPPNLGTRIFNPYCEDSVRKLWGEPQQAMSAEVVFKGEGLPVPEGIESYERVIIINPLETILCHTEEFIGGRFVVTGWMQGKSGWSRCFISVCMDAGLGDIGYVNRWTMEITNRHEYYALPLVVGWPIAKIAFLESRNGLEPEESYTGSYQQGFDINQIKRQWIPESMLPRLYKRR